MRILIAEDELPMQKILKLYLEKENYIVEIASTGEQALALACTYQFDLILLDWMLPMIEGPEVCRQLKERRINTKVLMLTSRSEIIDEYTGLSYGADDYLRKPFDPSILLLRIKKLLHTEETLTCGQLTLHQETGDVRLSQNTLSLTKKEYELLRLFMANKNIILSREQLIQRVWGFDYDGDERTLDTHVRRLRAKIGSDYIQTQVGLGYRMVDYHE